MTALEEIKKALEGVTPAAWRYRMKNWSEQYWHYFNNEPRFKEPDEIWEPLYSPTSLASTIEILQRQNEELQKKADARENELVAMLNSADESRVAQIRRAEAAEAEVKRLQDEIDRKSSMPGDHRYWEGRYRDEAAENEKLREALTPFAKFDLSELKQRAFLQILVCPESDDHDENFAPHFIRARTALASTGGEHHGN